MRRAEFRLARVLRARQLQESVAKAEWTSAEHALRESEAKAAAIEERIRRDHEELAGHLSATVRSAHALAAERLIASWQRARTFVEREKATHIEQAEKAMQAWKERHTRVEALEKLRDKHERQQAELAETEERKHMDEIALWRKYALRGADDDSGQERTQ